MQGHLALWFHFKASYINSKHSYLHGELMEDNIWTGACSTSLCLITMKCLQQNLKRHLILGP